MIRKTTIILGSIVLLSTAGYFYFRDYINNARKEPIAIGEKIVTNDEAFLEHSQKPNQDIPFESEVFIENLIVPWSIVFTSQNRVLVSERGGTIRIIENGTLLEDPLHTFDEVSSQAEEGLMGLALDPAYSSNSLVYACLAYNKGEELVDKVVRFQDQGENISDIEIILDDIPAARFHAGCRLGFGPDNKLYVTTGDATEKNHAQELDSLAGKILRVNTDGSTPDDNPFENSPVWTYGHRNPQGIAWHPETESLWSTEHGPSTFDGPPGGDEINLIKRGENYGWPLVSHQNNEEGLIAPKIVFTPAVAPASATFYSGEVFPQFKHNFFFGGLAGQGLFRVVLSDTSPDEVVYYEKLDIDAGRIRDVIEGPDGYIYYTTSNRDGRGDVQTGDDKIYRLVPSSGPGENSTQ